MSVNILEINNLSKYFGGLAAVSDCSLNVKRGTITGIIGPNGSGKTSLLKAIIGAVQPADGVVKLKPKLKIGYIPQRLNFDSTLPLTVERFMHLTEKVNKKNCTAALKTAGVPELQKKQMSNLSGGQFQRVLLARALLGSPEILILDEATQGLDQPGSAAFYRQIEDVRRNTGCAVLMISHDLHVVMSASDRVVCLNGHVCCAGTPSAVA